MTVAYDQLTKKLVSDPAALRDLRETQRRFLQVRDSTCASSATSVDFLCVRKLTAVRAGVLIDSLGSSFRYDSTEVPRQLWGIWRVTKTIPLSGIGCWSNDKMLLGTMIEYEAHFYRWQGLKSRNATGSIELMDGDSMMVGCGSGGCPSLGEYGIRSKFAEVVTLKSVPQRGSEDGGTPGSLVYLVSPNRITFDVCGSGYEAIKQR
jgi:hypothetical protein